MQCFEDAPLREQLAGVGGDLEASADLCMLLGLMTTAYGEGHDTYFGKLFGGFRDEDIVSCERTRYSSA